MKAPLSDKLAFALKALVMSRAGLASALNVDKSLVGRWVSGSVTPSEHNLARLTRFIATRVEGFTLLDWERDLDEFARLLGAHASGPAASPATALDVIPIALYEEAVRNTSQRGAAYEGIWKGTRASNDLPGRFVHDICMIQRREDGLIRFLVGVEGVRYEGLTLMLQNQLYSMGTDMENGSLMFSIFNGVARQRPDVLDGLNLTTLRDAGGSPAASPSILHRLEDLSGDRAADEARFEALVAALDPLAPEGSIAPELAAHLTTDATDGAPGVMRLLFARSMARGSRLNPDPAAPLA